MHRSLCGKNNQRFGEGIQEAFEGQDEAYNNLNFADNEVLGVVHYINFTKIVPHDLMKLWAMWKHLNLGYKVAFYAVRYTHLQLL